MIGERGRAQLRVGPVATWSIVGLCVVVAAAAGFALLHGRGTPEDEPRSATAPGAPMQPAPADARPKPVRGPLRRLPDRRGLELKGQVMRRDDNKPVVGARLTIGAVAESTGADGRFDFCADADDSDGVLVIRATGMKAVHWRARALSRLPDGALVRMEPGATMAGRVVDDSGAPVADAELRLFASVLGVETGRTGADGTLRVDGLGVGSYSVTAVPPIDDRLLLPAAVLDVDSSRQDVRIVCRRGSAVTGTVRESNGTPVAAADVVAVSGTKGDHATARVETRTAMDGSFRLPVEPGRAYDVVVTVPAGARGLSCRPMKAAHVVGDGPALSLVALPGKSIAGRVVGDGAARLGLIARSLAKPGHDVKARTDDEGAFEIDGLDAANYAVEVDADPSDGPRRSVLLGGERITAGEGAAALEVVETKLLQAAVVGVGGAPVPRAALRLERTDGRRVHHVQADQEGRFHAWLPAGAYSVAIRLAVRAGAKESFVDCGRIEVPAADAVVRVPR